MSYIDVSAMQVCKRNKKLYMQLEDVYQTIWNQPGQNWSKQTSAVGHGLYTFGYWEPGQSWLSLSLPIGMRSWVEAGWKKTKETPHQ